MMLRQLLVLCVPLVLCCAASAAQPRPIVGAIRWDAWHVGSENSPVRAMERSLGPKRYHHRLPFFAEVISDTEVKINGYTQAIVDQEIAYAKAGGLDYWAFLLYEPSSPMSQALSLYLSSKHRRDIGFCAIAGAKTFGEAASFPEKSKRILDLMSEPGYQRVAGGRPLLYVFNVSDDWIKAWGGEAEAGKLFDGFRAAAKARGLQDPYIVVMDFVPAHGKKVADAVHAEAISSYAISEKGLNGTPYVELTNAVEWFWDACAKTGAQVVPIAMAGWDRRPRVEHPVPWEKYQTPGAGMEKYYSTPTPPELAAHIRDAMDWAAAKKDVCPAQAVIIYAWNEHDEGGWLCPTRNPDGSANHDRLDAIAAMLSDYGKELRKLEGPNDAEARDECIGSAD